jgi:hypothetical protein
VLKDFENLDDRELKTAFGDRLPDVRRYVAAQA